MAIVQGRYVPPISDEQKADFLELICHGYKRPAAAEAVGGTARQFRALCNPQSPFFDAEFAKRYEGLTAPGAEQEDAIVERVESAFIERAVKDSDRAAEKVLAARSPLYSFLRPQSFKGAISIETVKLYLQKVPDDLLDQMIQAAEAEQKALPPVIDA